MVLPGCLRLIHCLEYISLQGFNDDNRNRVLRVRIGIAKNNHNENVNDTIYGSGGSKYKYENENKLDIYDVSESLCRRKVDAVKGEDGGCSKVKGGDNNKDDYTHIRVDSDGENYGGCGKYEYEYGGTAAGKVEAVVETLKRTVITMST